MMTLDLQPSSAAKVIRCRLAAAYLQVLSANNLRERESSGIPRRPTAEDDAARPGQRHHHRGQADTQPGRSPQSEVARNLPQEEQSVESSSQNGIDCQRYRRRRPLLSRVCYLTNS